MREGSFVYVRRAGAWGNCAPFMGVSAFGVFQAVLGHSVSLYTMLLCYSFVHYFNRERVCLSIVAVATDCAYQSREWQRVLQKLEGWRVKLAHECMHAR